MPDYVEYWLIFDLIEKRFLQSKQGNICLCPGSVSKETHLKREIKNMRSSGGRIYYSIFALCFPKMFQAYDIIWSSQKLHDLRGAETITHIL